MHQLHLTIFRSSSSLKVINNANALKIRSLQELIQLTELEEPVDFCWLDYFHCSVLFNFPISFQTERSLRIQLLLLKVCLILFFISLSILRLAIYF